MYKLPLNKQETDKERNIVYQICYESGYNKNTINKIENKIAGAAALVCLSNQGHMWCLILTFYCCAN